MGFCNKYSNTSSYKHLLTLMARGKLSFRIPPVSESCAASKKYNNQLRMPSNGRRKDLTIKY